MNVQEDIRPVTYLKARIAAILQQINRTHRPLVITQNGQPMAVLQDAETYERTKAAIGLLKLISQGEADVRAGRTVRQERLFARIEGKLRRVRPRA